MDDNNICSASVISLQEERLSMDSKEYRKYLMHQMANAIADLITERSDEFIEVVERRTFDRLDPTNDVELWKADLIYTMKVAVLTPQRYKELLEKEYRLEKLEW